MEENGEDVASLSYISTDGSYTDGSYTETVPMPMPNHDTLTASSQGSSSQSSFSATKSSRQPLWTDEETRAFIQVWGDDAVQSALASNYRTVAQFQWISDEMRARGYNRDWEQCRERAKALRRGFKVIVDGNSNARHGRRVWPYFEELNRFLCIKRNLVVPRLLGRNQKPAVNLRHREHREAQDAPYEQSPVGKSDKGTFEERDGDCLLLPKQGSQQSQANMKNHGYKGSSSCSRPRRFMTSKQFLMFPLKMMDQ
ncbi:zinc finger and SCAN domain-containing protein 20-like isoform X2 [Thamnophis elegans]|uniref:zinc finger and SCAN domain-containing protein 20-like isoform X2 n=1 Tax=Thamnophis elegans TaxID=35005 RepID=UPI0013787B9C|nr:zinc finger and SCAN domain-containing protein 20-like isoform X2 [Thamnophis elegans]